MHPIATRPLSLLAASLALALGLAGCGHAEDPSGPATPRDPVAVTLTDIDRRPFPLVVDVTGTLYGYEETTISAEVDGRISQVLADVGDRVEPTARLAQIDPTDYRLAVNERRGVLQEAVARLGLTEPPGEDFNVTTVPTVRRAKAETANAAAKMERGRQLFEQAPPLMSEQEYEDLVTAHEVAQGNEAVALLDAQSQVAQVRVRESELATAEQRLADAAVRAPAAPAGLTDDTALPPYAVVERLVSLGEYVVAGDPLYRLVVDHPLKYRAAVPERFLQTVERGQEILLRTEDGVQGVVGTIGRVAPAVAPTTRMFQIEATVDNAARHLRPGSFARGTITVGERSGVVYVPRASVVSFAGLDKVYTVADGKAVEHTVTLLKREGEWLPIDQDLPAEQVIAEGLANLADGVPVTVDQGATEAAP